MSRSVLWSVVIFTVFAFAALIIFFWVRDGSLREAGASMDHLLSNTGSKISSTTGEIVDGTGKAIHNATDRGQPHVVRAKGVSHMRLLATLVVVLAVGFLAVMGFYYFKDGSLQSAGAHVDSGLAKLDETTKPLQDSLGKVGDGVKDTVHNATDGNEHT